MLIRQSPQSTIQLMQTEIHHNNKSIQQKQPQQQICTTTTTNLHYLVNRLAKPRGLHYIHKAYDLWNPEPATLHKPNQRRAKKILLITNFIFMLVLFGFLELL